MTYAVKTLPDGDLSVTSVPADHQIGAGETLLDEVPDAELLGNYVLERGVLRERNAHELLERARAERLAALKALRAAIEFDAFPFDYEGTTHWIQSDETSLNRMDAIQIAIVSGDLSVFPVGWRTVANEWLMIADATAYSALMEGRRDHPRKTWQAYTLHEQTLKTHADPANYDITSGAWPVTRIDKSAF